MRDNPTAILKGTGQLIAEVHHELASDIKSVREEFAELVDRTVKQILASDQGHDENYKTLSASLEQLNCSLAAYVGDSQSATAEFKEDIQKEFTDAAQSLETLSVGLLQEVRSSLEEHTTAAAEQRSADQLNDAEAMKAIEKEATALRDEVRLALTDTAQAFRTLSEDLQSEIQSAAKANTAAAEQRSAELMQTYVETTESVENLIGRASEILAGVKDGADGEDGADGVDGKDGKDGIGKDGVDGVDGNDGLDRPLVDPVNLVSARNYPKNTIGVYGGGIWISHKNAIDAPGDDPHAWTCLLDGYTNFDVKLQEDNTFKAVLTMGSGKTFETNFKIPFPEHKGLYEEDIVYNPGQIVTKGTAFFQAMELTELAPPGNGWKQILVAPRGKAGRDGNDGKDGIDGVGKDGKDGEDGEDGKDAFVDPEFLMELRDLALSSEAKAFIDGREASYAITSFRGSFSSTEAYVSGDVVNSMGSVYLNIQSGTFKNVGSNPEAWVLMMGKSPAAAGGDGSSVIGTMVWKNIWKQQQYNVYETTRSGSATLVANKPTTEPAALYGVGDHIYNMQATLLPAGVTAKNILYGIVFTATDGAYSVDSIKFTQTAGFRYDAYYLENPRSANEVYRPLGGYIAESTGEVTLPLAQILVAETASLEIGVFITDPQPPTSSFNGNWDYKTPGVLPATIDPGQMVQVKNDLQFIYFSTTDNDAVDRSAEFATILPGDTITDGIITWTVNESTDQGDNFKFQVSPPQKSAASDGVLNYTFSQEATSALPLESATDYWLTDDRYQGIYGVDQTFQGAVVNDDAYWLDIRIQRVQVSEDWDILALSSSAGVIPPGEEPLTRTERTWLRETSGPINKYSQQTIGGAWTEARRFTVPEGVAIHGHIDVAAERADPTPTDQYFVTVAVLYWNELGTVTVSFKKGTELGNTSPDVRVIVDGLDVVLEVRGKNGETWDFHMTSFKHSLN